MLGLLVINSDSHGNPGPYGYSHVVVVSDSPLPTVSQMQLPFGALDNVSCVVADCICIGLVFGKSVLPSTLLADLHTHFPKGTDGQYIPPTLLSVFGVHSHWQIGNVSLSPCWVMNPAAGILIPPGLSWPYLAASANEMVVIDDVVPASNPKPVGGTPVRRNPEEIEVVRVDRPAGAGYDTFTAVDGTGWYSEWDAGGWPVGGRGALPGSWATFVSGRWEGYGTPQQILRAFGYDSNGTLQDAAWSSSTGFVLTRH